MTEVKTKKVKMKLSKFQKYLIIKSIESEINKIKNALDRSGSFILNDAIEDLLEQYSQIQKQIKN